MGFVKPLNLLYFAMNAAQSVTLNGMVLSLQAAGTLIRCPAGGTPIGVAYMTTEDPLFDPNSINHVVQFLLGMEMGVIREGVADVPVHLVGGEAIAITDVLSMLNANTAGYARVHVPTALPAVYAAATVMGCLEEAETIVGIALDAMAMNVQTGVNNIPGCRTLLQIADVDYDS